MWPHPIVGLQIVYSSNIFPLSHFLPFMKKLQSISQSKQYIDPDSPSNGYEHELEVREIYKTETETETESLKVKYFFKADGKILFG